MPGPGASGKNQRTLIHSRSEFPSHPGLAEISFEFIAPILDPGKRFCKQSRVIPRTHDTFPATRWSLIREISSDQEEKGAEALAEFCRQYRAPLLKFATATISRKQDAEDYIQSFFEKMLERNFLPTANPDRGKLRTFLLTCLKRHIATVQRHSLSAKRGGGKAEASYEEALIVADGEPSPEEIFHRHWVRHILNSTLARMEHSWTARGKSAVFQSLKPFLAATGEEPGHHEIAASLGMNIGAFRTTLYRMRGEYREHLREEIAETLTIRSADAINEELKELLRWA